MQLSHYRASQQWHQAAILLSKRSAPTAGERRLVGPRSHDSGRRRSWSCQFAEAHCVLSLSGPGAMLTLAQACCVQASLHSRAHPRDRRWRPRMRSRQYGSIAETRASQLSGGARGEFARGTTARHGPCGSTGRRECTFPHFKGKCVTTRSCPWAKYAQIAQWSAQSSPAMAANVLLSCPQAER